MDDPRELPPPDNFVDRVHALARDLAYGFLAGEFSAKFSVTYYVGGLADWHSYDNTKISI